MRFCKCTKSYGRYVNNISAEFAGPCVPIGISNQSLSKAIRDQPLFGLGKIFEAFTVPIVSKTFKRMENDKHNGNKS
jgi:hypothetical protein